MAPRNSCRARVRKGRMSYGSNNLFGMPTSSVTLRSAYRAQVLALGDVNQFGGFDSVRPSDADARVSQSLATSVKSANSRYDLSRDREVDTSRASGNSGMFMDSSARPIVSGISTGTSGHEVGIESRASDPLDGAGSSGDMRSRLRFWSRAHSRVLGFSMKLHASLFAKEQC